jgi:hypothetical protein
MEQAFPSTPKGNLLLLTILTGLTLPPNLLRLGTYLLTPSEQRVYLPPTPVEGMGGAAHVVRKRRDRLPPEQVEGRLTS